MDEGLQYSMRNKDCRWPVFSMISLPSLFIWLFFLSHLCTLYFPYSLLWSQQLIHLTTRPDKRMVSDDESGAYPHRQVGIAHGVMGGRVEEDDDTGGGGGVGRVGGAKVSDAIQEAEPTCVITINDKLHHKPSLLKVCGESCSIYRVPCILSEGNQKAYEPQIVSIGPLHHGKQNLQAMEEHKWLYLQRLLSRIPEKNFESYLTVIKASPENARDYYSETIKLDDDALTEMMVIDGCFIIELLRMLEGELPESSEDPIFKMCWIMPVVKRDMLMLENQVPFFILQLLFDHTTMPGNKSSSLNKLALDFFNDLMPSKDTALFPDKSTKILHMLHVLHSSLIPPKEQPLARKSSLQRSPCCCVKQIREKQSPRVQLIYCVTELRAAGIEIEKRGGHNFLNVKFEKGVLLIPPIFVDDDTTSLFLNLVAFEQCYGWCTTHITTYTTFMDCLIDSPGDVKFLRHNGIIENWLGSDADVAKLFNNLGREIALDIDGCYLSHVFMEVNSYCKTDWHEWRASLIQDYFKNPWAILSFVAAVVLLILTFSQTLFSFLSYFKPPS